MKLSDVKLSLSPTIYRSIPWILFGVVLMPAVATSVVGILVLVLGGALGDIVLGVLTICFAVFALTGTFITLGLLHRQNRLALMQTDFIANVSHELRTPLTSIRMYVDTLRLGRVSSAEDTEACLAALDKETARLSGLVEQLLGFRKSSSGDAGAAQRDAVRLERLVPQAVGPFQQRPNGGDRIEVVMEPALPPVRVSREGFHEALSNLVENALTHGGKSGPIVVTLRADHEGVAVDVRDTGPGISEAEQDKVFERFYRGSHTTDSKVPGFGLGLSIVERFITDHDGRVTVKSAPGSGAIFTIWLPATDQPVVEDRAEPGTEEGDAGKAREASTVTPIRRIAD